MGRETAVFNPSKHLEVISEKGVLECSYIVLNFVIF
jgi:hypothetical protein